ncbi:sirohydrochlorin ferrochelatase [Methylacidiphilum sp. Yel]|uniref:CbiX/SirB N-terminal domain-containing protein n=1 Tax=Methylacidiphilum sp. Yel TaxID=1847730 RepID=UPI00106AA8D7|nr:CbiX/SirB N-terminal domain-containing protein [Methylacidiphilum sp. Yel]TFE70756.1 sirohydrochlorin ferrochelatase [Methylacidiphilum sp. Yel]
MSSFPHAIDWSKASLVLAGHGSLYNSEAALPVYINAEKIRNKKLFENVYETFWKEEPSFHQTLLSIPSSFIYVVPFFLSHGFFTAKVIPAEMGIEGPMTRMGKKMVHYCRAVGENPRVSELIIEAINRAIDFKMASSILSESALLLVSHGTKKNVHSKETTYLHWNILQKKGIFKECHVFFLEEEPRISSWKEYVRSKYIFAVPFFISEGDHSYVDVPKLMGIKKSLRTSPISYPQDVEGRYVWYTKAVGTMEGMEQVILEQVVAFDESFGKVAKVAF